MGKGPTEKYIAACRRVQWIRSPLDHGCRPDTRTPHHCEICGCELQTNWKRRFVAYVKAWIKSQGG